MNRFAPTWDKSAYDGSSAENVPSPSANRNPNRVIRSVIRCVSHRLGHYNYLVCAQIQGIS